VLVGGCRGNDPGFDVVRVPATAYASLDGGSSEGGDAGEGGAPSSAMIVCVAAPTEHGDDEEMSSDYDDCPLKRGERTLDEHVTKRHRDKDDQTACCYRKGRFSPATE
jgi:hypothetical protein